MSDDELVQAVANEVMPKAADGSPWIATHHKWNPLVDWNDAMQIDHVIAMMPYSARELYQKLVTDNGEKWFADISQRDMLEAALQVVRSKTP